MNNGLNNKNIIDDHRTLCGLMLEECLGLVSTLAGGGAHVRGCDQHQHCHHGHRSHHHRDH